MRCIPSGVELVPDLCPTSYIHTAHDHSYPFKAPKKGFSLTSLSVRWYAAATERTIILYVCWIKPLLERATDSRMEWSEANFQSVPLTSAYRGTNFGSNQKHQTTFGHKVLFCFSTESVKQHLDIKVCLVSSLLNCDLCIRGKTLHFICRFHVPEQRNFWTFFLQRVNYLLGGF